MCEAIRQVCDRQWTKPQEVAFCWGAVGGTVLLVIGSLALKGVILSGGMATPLLATGGALMGCAITLFAVKSVRTSISDALYLRTELGKDHIWAILKGITERRGVSILNATPAEKKRAREAAKWDNYFRAKIIKSQGKGGAYGKALNIAKEIDRLTHDANNPLDFKTAAKMACTPHGL